MKKILFGILGVLLLSGCTNKEMVTYYENNKAGGKIDSYQLDLRIYGNDESNNYNEIVRVDNYKGTQFKVDYISKNILPVIPEELEEKPEEGEEENPEETRPFLRDTASYRIDGKNYELKDDRSEVVMIQNLLRLCRF